MGVNIL